VDSQKYKPAEGQVKAELRQTLDILENALVFIFAGSGFERKNLGATLRAFSQLPENCYLVVVGRDKKHRAYHRLANQLNCGNRVRFLGAQEKSKMPTLYQLADVLVLPTIYDPFPNVILEALATGLPCITTANCGAVDVIPSANCGVIVEMADDQGLADAMAGYQDAERLNVESGRARELALTFTQQRMQTSLLSLYREILN
jgi:UDP-glucose:(heptosyl)LPS alpha-1,3-glucosyltransferase